MQARNESFAKARQARCRRKKIHETVQSLVMMEEACLAHKTSKLLRLKWSV
jgi:hypothetical protein